MAAVRLARDRKGLGVTMWLRDRVIPNNIVLRMVRTQPNPSYPKRTEVILVAQGHNRLDALSDSYEMSQAYPDDGTRWWLEGEILP